MAENIERELGWDDEIERDGGEYTLLPAGDYPFTVTSFERGRHNPGPDSKLPPCPKATLEITVHATEGDVKLNHDLFLHTRTEGFLCAFFTSIGQRKHGEKLRMDWSKVVGSKGRLQLEQVPGYKDPTKTYNKIKKFYEPEEAKPWQEGTF